MEVQRRGGRRPGGLDLKGLAKQQLITVVDAATVSWPSGAKKPKTRQLHSLTGAGALGGAFWGMLFGLLFFVPLLGMAVELPWARSPDRCPMSGSTTTSSSGARDEITPGTSALFLMSSGAVVDKVRDAFRGQQAELVSTNLSDDQERKLREVFGE